MPLLSLWLAVSLNCLLWLSYWPSHLLGRSLTLAFLLSNSFALCGSLTLLPPYSFWLAGVVSSVVLSFVKAHFLACLISLTFSLWLAHLRCLYGLLALCLWLVCSITISVACLLSVACSLSRLLAFSLLPWFAHSLCGWLAVFCRSLACFRSLARTVFHSLARSVACYLSIALLLFSAVHSFTVSVTCSLWFSCSFGLWLAHYTLSSIKLYFTGPDSKSTKGPAVVAHNTDNTIYAEESATLITLLTCGYHILKLI